MNASIVSIAALAASATALAPPPQKAAQLIAAAGLIASQLASGQPVATAAVRAAMQTATGVPTLPVPGSGPMARSSRAQ